MHRYSARIRPLGSLIGIVSLASLTGVVNAGGFALIEHGASGMGNAYAGAAAVSNDPSTVWFNPAGMSELDGRQVSVGIHLLKTDTTWTDEGTTLGALLGRGEASGPDTSEPGTLSTLPNFYYVAPINQQWSYGLSIGVPFGSSTEYDRDWKGRYSTVKSGIEVIDINPAISYKMSEKVSLGFGISVQQLSAELASAVDSGAACLRLAADRFDTSFTTADCINAGLTPGNVENDGYAEVTGDSIAMSFNMGALFKPRNDLKIGVAYRHSIDHEIDGDGDFTTPENLQAIYASNTTAASQPLTNSFLTDTGAKAEVDLPATFSISTAWQTTDKVQLLGDITWTGWSSFEELRIRYENEDQGETLSTQSWEDVFRYSVGINYAYSDKLVLRTGVAYDEEAIPNAQLRTARIPGNDRTWFSVGAGYQLSKRVSFDLGYAHLFLDETPIDHSSPESGGTAQEVRGTYDSTVDILSAQINWEFN
ncbi:OmpP1/FadL family transporter [Granulosicoccus antarcticus]|uniref:Outer membrane protein n=1 Tax=Granulosicoccus antarcticus IMCC3135 TaxID=1192854 RepID=A0A2Z2NTW6_9GAMM|nr:porin [Granulosicoccus antarcticus]ASJ74749.1 Putative outer membrane protein [Granulosicoccus antarcticus IMCC3135]